MFYKPKHSKPTDYRKLFVSLVVAGSFIGGFAFGIIHSAKKIEQLEETNERLRWEKAIIEQDRQTRKTKKTHSLGHFTCTAYCGCRKCCGHSHGITKSGTVAKANRTIAVDTRRIPLGTKVCVNGKWYIAEDTGKSIKGKRIDIFFDNHEEAMEFGKQKHKVIVERAEA